MLLNQYFLNLMMGDELPIYVVMQTRYSQNGELGSWLFQARPQILDDSTGEGLTREHVSLESLAKELVTFPGIPNVMFIPGTLSGKGPRVVIQDGKLTQEGLMDDEILGRLTVRVHKEYAKLHPEP
ncbi:hypothetical protein ACFL2V_18810 [Pseudomonadota bacterium]